jgi:hypothetical protein
VLPKARTDKLTTREIGDETLVYDMTCTQAHCLNRTAALVWRLCDGRTTIEALARRVEQELHVEQGKELVQLALEQLDRKHLLEKPVKKLSLTARRARRHALVKMAFVAAALPVIMTLTARKARASASQTTAR